MADGHSMKITVSVCRLNFWFVGFTPVGCMLYCIGCRLSDWKSEGRKAWDIIDTPETKSVFLFLSHTTLTTTLQIKICLYLLLTKYKYWQQDVTIQYSQNYHINHLSYKYHVYIIIREGGMIQNVKEIRINKKTETYHWDVSSLQCWQSNYNTGNIRKTEIKFKNRIKRNASHQRMVWGEWL